MQVEKERKEILMGEFFGTDFNFLSSIEMQTAILENCLPANWDQLLNFSNYRSGGFEEIG